MKTLKKIIILLVLAGTMILPLAGCGLFGTSVQGTITVKSL